MGDSRRQFAHGDEPFAAPAVGLQTPHVLADGIPFGRQDLGPVPGEQHGGHERRQHDEQGRPDDEGDEALLPDLHQLLRLDAQPQGEVGVSGCRGPDLEEHAARRLDEAEGVECRDSRTESRVVRTLEPQGRIRRRGHDRRSGDERGVAHVRCASQLTQDRAQTDLAAQRHDLRGLKPHQHPAVGGQRNGDRIVLRGTSGIGDEADDLFRRRQGTGKVDGLRGRQVRGLGRERPAAFLHELDPRDPALGHDSSLFGWSRRTFSEIIDHPVCDREQVIVDGGQHGPLGQDGLIHGQLDHSQ